MDGNRLRSKAGPALSWFDFLWVGKVLRLMKKLELLLSLVRRWSLTLESCESLALSEKQTKF
jgi:hypothetical protein